MTDHTEEAHRHINWAHEWQEMEGDTPEANIANAHLAVAHATLALAEQQRIANLIALENQRNKKTQQQSHYYGADLLYDEPCTLYGNWELRPEIAAALGITEKS